VRFALLFLKKNKIFLRGKVTFYLYYSVSCTIFYTMEIVYIFCEAKHIRIPLFGYYQNLYRYFITRGGRWNNIRNEFILDGNINI